MKILRFIFDNILFIFTLFLLAFVPLYPKLPAVDVEHTWVYIRAEDFVVAFVFLIWVLLLLFKKITLKTPLTLPIILFWIVGGISTLHGVLLIFPTLSDVFSNVGFLSYLRRIEYVFLFFIGYEAIKDRRSIFYVIGLLAVVLILIAFYGFGQKLYGFPAFLTMNEEFAKGIPIHLSQFSRVPSTFAGHYDLAAYLVLIIPLLVGLSFGFKNWIVKISILVVASLGFALLFMTVSRVSFLVLLLSLVILLLFQKKRLVIISLFALTLLFLILSPSLLARFGSTVSEVDVLVDAKTGEEIGHVKEVNAQYFDNKVIYRQPISSQDSKLTSYSAILPHILIPAIASLVVETNNPTGENLPQGSSYINLTLSPVIKKENQYFYQKSNDKGATESANIRVFYGEFLIKRAKAYDLSFTTRFQGEWPRTITGFKRNIILGSGYGSVSLAVDNNYLRILGESGLLGFIAFLSIFIISGIYIKKTLPNVDSKVVKSFVLGFVAGTFGLALNALLIDVFEASKIAFTYWLLMGITLGVLKLYKKEDIDLFKEFKNLLTSTYAVVFYFLVVTGVLFFSASSNYFVGDDFTWFRWVSDCCNNILNYFTNSHGFFYRPGTKLYFSLMYSAFWLNQSMYHFVSIFLHFAVTLLVFLISKKILKDYFLSIVAAILFVILSGHHEAIFWISSTGFLFNAMFALLSLIFFIYWKEKNKIIYLVISVISSIFSLLFHELGVIVPFLIILYDTVFGEKLSLNNLLKKAYYLVFLSVLLLYLTVRYLSQSHWFNGDYSYNLIKLPFNVVGNTIGYIALDLFGPASLPFYQGLRNFSKEHLILSTISSILIIFIVFIIYRMIIRKMLKDELKIVIFGFLFFVISLLPFLGLGTITSRYSYLSSVGFVMFFAFFLKKIYSYLTNINGKRIAVGSIAVIAIVFGMIQLFQVQKIHTDWRVAGEKSKTFIISLNGIYADSWKNQSMQFYFVNVPIRQGEAWVFPVGLSDAVWFVFRNDNLGVHQVPSLNQAFNIIENPLNEKVFEFDSTGAVAEREKTKRGILLQ